ncbi:hypothetical protein [Treponema endosymbiont of Eucomonympha sp.]|nr:hypothetical protein [Treponema endosymbiont of Eucomonympha sp.]
MNADLFTLDSYAFICRSYFALIPLSWQSDMRKKSIVHRAFSA